MSDLFQRLVGSGNAEPLVVTPNVGYRYDPTPHDSPLVRSGDAEPTAVRDGRHPDAEDPTRPGRTPTDAGSHGSGLPRAPGGPGGRPARVESEPAHPEPAAASGHRRGPPADVARPGPPAKAGEAEASRSARHAGARPTGGGRLAAPTGRGSDDERPGGFSAAPDRHRQDPAGDTAANATPTHDQPAPGVGGQSMPSPPGPPSPRSRQPLLAEHSGPAPAPISADLATARTGTSADPGTSPDVTVTIGHIEVVAPRSAPGTDKAPPPRRQARPRRVLGLDDYLSTRRGPS